MLHATFLAAVTEFVWLPWKAAQEAGLALEGATQGGSQVRRPLSAVLGVPLWHPACRHVCSCGTQSLILQRPINHRPTRRSPHRSPLPGGARCH